MLGHSISHPLLSNSEDLVWALKIRLVSSVRVLLCVSFFGKTHFGWSDSFESSAVPSGAWQAIVHFLSRETMGIASRQLGD